MDYKKWIDDLKELIEYLRYSDDEYRLCELKLKSSISIIETLLAERDAAVEEIRGICSFCAHKKTCQFGNHLRDICVNGNKWQWRGPQKEDGA